MDSNLIDNVVVKPAVSGATALMSWGLQDISYIASIVASIIAIIVGGNSLYHIIKGWLKK
jgi:hypothetical protein